MYEVGVADAVALITAMRHDAPSTANVEVALLVILLDLEPQQVRELAILVAGIAAGMADQLEELTGIDQVRELGRMTAAEPVT